MQAIIKIVKKNLKSIEWLWIWQGLCIIISLVPQKISLLQVKVLSIPRLSQELGRFYGTLWCILHLDLHLNPYKVQLTQQLKPTTQRRRYVEWLFEQQAVDSNFSNKIFFSDKAYFTLGGYVNKQNCRI